ncbi:uncharacterized protein LOC109802700 [Cajanus cajan]|uniref:uncharacterized protein LOC109802700 n=1 Tax=Cajanus cajan TaxID=3821 RepID=UPI00098DD65A|nr:uncharacterized protein LOC109802700 [Cajanus cajan]
MLEKTFSTFHASNVLLQQQYREKGFKKYAELISCLLLAEQNNELLLKNHEARPIGSAPFLEVNVATHGKETSGQGYGHNRGNNHGRGRGRGHGRGRGSKGGRGHDYEVKNNFSHQKWKNNGKNKKEMDGHGNKHEENKCYRCGAKGH